MHPPLRSLALKQQFLRSRYRRRSLQHLQQLLFPQPLLFPDHLTGNTFDSPGGGLLVQNGTSNTLTRNLFTNHANPPWAGLTLVIATGTEVYNNNFEANALDADDFFGSGNLFNLAAPIGGNWFADFNEPSEGCFDVDPPAGFCDLPFSFAGLGAGTDFLPSASIDPFDLIPNQPLNARTWPSS